MNVNEMLSENSFVVGLKPSSKKHILEELSKLAEKELNISSRDILESLIKREKLGSTAVGNGIAIPHATDDSIEKPKGFVATAQGGIVKKSVQELIRNAHPENVSPIGDMGRPITGLLFFTNDDALRKKLNNAQKKILMVYQVVLDKSISAAKIEMLKSGIGLRGFVYQVKDVEYIKGGTKREIGIEAYNLTPGTLSKMLEKLEFEVLQMDRMLFAGLTKKDLPRGNWRKLTLKEVNFLQML